MAINSTHAEYAVGLRQLADLIEATPDIRIAYSDLAVWSISDRDVMAALARAALHAGAKVDKDITELMHTLVVRFGPINARALAYRDDVCERVVVGTREVTEMVPDPALPAPPMVERTRTEDIVEWRCTPLLAPAEGGAS